MDIPPADKRTALGEGKARFLQEFLRDKAVTLSLETGFAYGGSAAHIISSTHAPHYVIDPFQQTVFKGSGEQNLAKLGLDGWLRPIYEPAHLALPHLLKEGLAPCQLLINGYSVRLFPHLCVGKCFVWPAKLRFSALICEKIHYRLPITYQLTRH